MQIQIFATYEDIFELMDKIKEEHPEVRFIDRRGRPFEYIEGQLLEVYASNLDNCYKDDYTGEKKYLYSADSYGVELRPSGIKPEKRSYSYGRIYLCKWQFQEDIMYPTPDKLVNLYKNIVKIVKKVANRWYTKYGAIGNVYALKHADDIICQYYDDFNLIMHEKSKKKNRTGMENH